MLGIQEVCYAARGQHFVLCDHVLFIAIKSHTTRQRVGANESLLAAVSSTGSPSLFLLKLDPAFLKKEIISLRPSRGDFFGASFSTEPLNQPLAPRIQLEVELGAGGTD